MSKFSSLASALARRAASSGASAAVTSAASAAPAGPSMLKPRACCPAGYTLSSAKGHQTCRRNTLAGLGALGCGPVVPADAVDGLGGFFDNPLVQQGGSQLISLGSQLLQKELDKRNPQAAVPVYVPITQPTSPNPAVQPEGFKMPAWGWIGIALGGAGAVYLALGKKKRRAA